MAEQSPGILDMLGLGAGAATVGIGAFEYFQLGQKVAHDNKRMKGIVDASLSKVITPKAPNVVNLSPSAAGLTDLSGKVSRNMTMTVDQLKQSLQHSYGSMHDQFTSELGTWLGELKGRGINDATIFADTLDGNITNVSLRYGQTSAGNFNRSYSFDTMLDQDGLYSLNKYGSESKSAAPSKIMFEDTFNAIKSGKINESNLQTTIDSLGNYNTGILQATRQFDTRNMGVPNQALNNNNIVDSFRQLVTHSTSLRDTDTNRIVPMLWDDKANNFRQYNPMTETNDIQSYVNAFGDSALKDPNAKSSIHYGMNNVSETAYGVTSNPYVQHDPNYNAFAGGNKELRQTIDKTSYIEGDFLTPKVVPLSTADGKGSHIAAIRTIVDDAPRNFYGKNKPTTLLNELLQSGVANKGVPLAPIQGEEFYISKRLGKKSFKYNKRRVFDLSDEATDVTGLQKQLDIMALHYQYSNKTQATLASNMPATLQEAQNQLEAAYADVSSQTFKDWQNIRKQDIQQLVSDGSLNKYLKDNPFAVNSKQVLTKGPTGVKRIGQYGKEEITGISTGGTHNGLTITSRVVNKFRDRLKFWGSHKGIATNAINDPTKFGRFHFGLNRFIQTNKDKAGVINHKRNARIVGKMLRGYDGSKKNKTSIALHNIVNKQIAEAFPGVDTATINKILSVDLLTGKSIRKGLAPLRSNMFREQANRLIENGLLDSRYGKVIEDSFKKNDPTTFIKHMTKLFIGGKKNPSKFKDNSVIQNTLANILTDGERAGHTTDIVSIGTSLKELGIGNTPTWSEFGVDQLRNLRQDTVADRMASNFNISEYKNFVDTYTGALGGQLSKDAGVVSVGSMSDGKLKQLLAMKPEDAIKELQNMPDVEGFSGNKSATRFYVQLSQEYSTKIATTKYVALPLFESNSFIGNIDFGKGTKKKNIKKIVNKETERVINADLRGNLNGLESYAESMAKVLNVKNFTKANIKGGKNLLVKPADVLQKDYLNKVAQMGGKDGEAKVLGALRNQGIDIKSIDDIDKVLAGEVSHKDYWSMARQTDKYRELYDAHLASMDPNDVAALTQSKKLRGTVERAISKDLYKNGTYAVSTRPPGYSVFGVSGNQIVNQHALLNELDSIRGGSSAERIRDNMVGVTKRSAQFGQMDFDDDPFAALPLRSQAEIDEMKVFLNGEHAVEELWGDKGAIAKNAGGTKALFNKFGISINDHIASGLAEAVGIGQITNQSKVFQGGLIDAFADDIVKRESMTDILMRLPEAAIGGKHIKNPDELGQILDIFKGTQGVDKRAEILQYWAQKTTDQDKQTVLNGRFTLDDYKQVIKSGDAFVASDAGRLHASLLHNDTSIHDIWNQMKLARTGVSGSGNSNVSSQLVESVMSEGQIKGAINKFGALNESFFKRISKNNGLRWAAGIGLGAMLLRPSDTNIKNQAVREESQPKRRPLQGAEAINPHTGEVYRRGPQGYNISVRGSLPQSADANLIQQQVSQMGIPFGGSVVGRTPGVDAQYLNDLNYQNTSLQWNNG